jgi:hypothetical protein
LPKQYHIFFSSPFFSVKNSNLNFQKKNRKRIQKVLKKKSKRKRKTEKENEKSKKMVKGPGGTFWPRPSFGPARHPGGPIT